MDFDWDPAKHATVLSKRGFSFADAVAIFGGPVLVRRDAGWIMETIGTSPLAALAPISSRSSTPTAVRWIITAWRSNRKERAAWQRSVSPTP